MTARYPLVLNGTTIQELQSGDTIAGLPTTTGTSILKGDGAGGITNATGGTDYQTAQSVTGIVKSSGTTRSAAVAGTDYVPPSGTGATGSWGISITGNAANATNAIGGPTSGQTWQNVYASRAAGTTYTNSTGKPIEVSITTNSNGSAGNDARCYVDAINVSWYGINSGANAATQQVFVVPNGSTYRVTISGGMSVNLWAELR